MTTVLDLTARLERLALECQDCGTDWVARVVGLCPHCGSQDVEINPDDLWRQWRYEREREAVRT